MAGLFRFCCASADQKERALPLTQCDKCEVSCVSLRNRVPLKWVISGVSWKVYFEELKNIPAVIDARRINCVVKK